MPGDVKEGKGPECKGGKEQDSKQEECAEKMCKYCLFSITLPCTLAVVFSRPGRSQGLLYKHLCD